MNETVCADQRSHTSGVMAALGAASRVYPTFGTLISADLAQARGPMPSTSLVQSAESWMAGTSQNKSGHDGESATIRPKPLQLRNRLGSGSFRADFLG